MGEKRIIRVRKCASNSRFPNNIYLFTYPPSIRFDGTSKSSPFWLPEFYNVRRKYLEVALKPIQIYKSR